MAQGMGSSFNGFAKWEKARNHKAKNTTKKNPVVTESGSRTDLNKINWEFVVIVPMATSIKPVISAKLRPIRSTVLFILFASLTVVGSSFTAKGILNINQISL